MMDELEQSKRAGTFKVSPSKSIYGELTLAGQNTSLYLRHNEDFDTLNVPGNRITGTLHDLTKVTLLHCIPVSPALCTAHRQEIYYSANIFPHYVLHGYHHITHDEKVITEVNFVIDDANTLFEDFDTFGVLFDAHPFAEQIIRAVSKRCEREIPTGDHPIILYFTGKREIFSADTVMGRVCASHNPTPSLVGSSVGVHLKNTIFISIIFEETCTFDEAIAHAHTLLKYLEMLVGRPQNLLSLNLWIETNDNLNLPGILEVYWSHRPKRTLADNKEHPSPGVLIDAVRQPDIFSRILINWLDRHHDWHDSRSRFSVSFSEKGYSIDRLIRSANMFDILPGSAIPADIPLSEELKFAKEKCREIFKELPISPERDSVLSALGRIGKRNLKSKIRYRGQLIVDVAGEKFPELFTVTDEAVNCRNHYVHGSESKIDYSSKLDVVIFLTNTLEFVFAASDLVEAGWDIKAWSESANLISHPFEQYCFYYGENLEKLKTFLI
jgi:hypothetical protein